VSIIANHIQIILVAPSLPTHLVAELTKSLLFLLTSINVEILSP
jgi:hypothetical protein